MDCQQMTFIGKQGTKRLLVYRGGFPCQPHSVAGKRQASSDERDLWPEMRRVISEIKPKWVVAENVPGLLSSENGRFFANVLRDFAEMGFDVGWGITSAAAVGAIHRRERLVIIAHASSIRLQRRFTEEERHYSNEQSKRMFTNLLRCADESYIHKSAILGRNNGLSNRVDRTKSLGNAVVPQAFYPFFKAIYDLETEAT